MVPISSVGLIDFKKNADGKFVAALPVAFPSFYLIKFNLIMPDTESGTSSSSVAINMSSAAFGDPSKSDIAITLGNANQLFLHAVCTTTLSNGKAEFVSTKALGEPVVLTVFSDQRPYGKLFVAIDSVSGLSSESLSTFTCNYSLIGATQL